MGKGIHVMIDAAFTRRKNRHHVFDDQDEHLATHGKFSDVLDWLYHNGHERAEFHTEDASYAVVITKIPDK